MIFQPWSEDRNWEQRDAKLSQLASLPLILPHTQRLADRIDLQPAGIIMVKGPRQCGKSTMVRQLIQRALRAHLPAENIGLIEADPLENRGDLAGEITAFRNRCTGYALLIIDEITSVEKWWLALKSVADQGVLSGLLLVCTGSSADEMIDGADLLPGRRGQRYPVDFELLPVRYADVARHIALAEFQVTGGFPWPVNEFLKTGRIPGYVYDLTRAWIQGAFIRRKHLVSNLAPLLGYIAERVGTPYSVTGLARDCGLGSNHTAESYLALMERNFILLSSSWSEPGSGVRAPRKNRKFYPADPFLFHLFGITATDLDTAYDTSRERCADGRYLGRVAECVVAAELRHRAGMYPLSYFLGRKEIDFVGKGAVEVKYQGSVKAGEFAWVEKVLPPPLDLTVVTRETHSIAGRVRCVPLQEWLREDAAFR